MTTFRINQDGYLHIDHSRTFDPAATYQEPLPLFYLEEIIKAIGSSKIITEISTSGSNVFSIYYNGRLVLCDLDKKSEGESVLSSHNVFFYCNGELLEDKDMSDTSEYFLFSVASNNTSYWVFMPDNRIEAISF